MSDSPFPIETSLPPVVAQIPDGGAKRGPSPGSVCVVETCEEKCSTSVGWGVYVGTPVVKPMLVIDTSNLDKVFGGGVATQLNGMK